MHDTAMRTILVADDEGAIRTLIHAIVEDSGCRIIQASDGVTALEMARAHKPDLVIIDWMMPGMTGVEVTRALRAEPATSNTPVVLLTARHRGEDRAAGTAAGANAYLVKPFSPLELLELVEGLLGRS